MRTLSDIPDIEDKLVLVRAGLNVPVHNGVVLDDFRVQKALPTLLWLMEHKARVVVMAHLGRGGGDSMRIVADVLNKYIPTEFVTTIDEAKKKAVAGHIVVIENVRSDEREVENDDNYARELADGFDLFVQDAFEACHREHTSIVGVPKYLDSYAGLLLEEEVAMLTKARTPEAPALFVLGGGKQETKEPLLQQLLPAYDTVFIGGTLQNEILAARGLEVGRSVIEDGAVPFDILTTTKAHDIEDVLVEHVSGAVQSVSVGAVLPTDTIVDMGVATTTALIDRLGEFKTVVWNGPLGWYEKGYDEATVRLAHALASTNATTIVGGGDTVAVLEKEGLVEKLSFVSTGGGAMLQFLEHGTLPGIEALG